jgi:E3 ubiquitin-protein ligase BRE1
VFDLTLHVSAEPEPSQYVEELRKRMHATEQLVLAFVRVGGEARSQLLHDKNHASCIQAQTKVCGKWLPLRL